MKIRFETIGCRLNQIESESAARIFIDKSFDAVLEPLSAASAVDNDTLLCVVNTCAVTQKAEQKARRIIRLILEKCPFSAVIVTGCYAQLSAADISAMDSRIAVLPGQLKSRITAAADIFENHVKAGVFSAGKFAAELRSGICIAAPEKPGISENAFRLATDSFIAHSRSSIKIQDGCNNSCSYCAIHIARGRSVSLDVKSVIDRVKLLEKNGQAEAVFTSVNIGQYRGEYNGRYLNFAQLLEILLKETDKIAFRMSSLYPEIVDSHFCSVIRSPRVRPHFHLSVQSGSDSVLAAMGRKYTSGEVRKACSMLKESKENPFLACDIITGFPGETEEDFEQTMKLCMECGFAWVHVFPFSARPGTTAAVMKNKVPQSVSGERAARLALWAAQSKVSYINSWKGRPLEAVMETVKPSRVFVSAVRPSVYHAVTENFLHCEIAAEAGIKAPLPGSTVKIMITDPIEQSIRKGGEIECAAVFYDKAI